MSITMKDNIIMIGDTDDKEIEDMEWHDYPADLFRLIEAEIIKTIKEHTTAADSIWPIEMSVEDIYESVAWDCLYMYHIDEITSDIDRDGISRCCWTYELESCYDELAEQADEGTEHWPQFKPIESWNQEITSRVVSLLVDGIITGEYPQYSIHLTEVIIGFSEYLGITMIEDNTETLLMNPQIPLFRIEDDDIYSFTVVDEESGTLHIVQEVRYWTDILADAGLSATDFELCESMVSDKAFAVGKGSLSQIIIRVG